MRNQESGIFVVSVCLFWILLLAAGVAIAVVFSIGVLVTNNAIAARKPLE